MTYPNIEQRLYSETKKLGVKKHNEKLVSGTGRESLPPQRTQSTCK